MCTKEKSFDEIYGNYTLPYYRNTIYSSKDDFRFLKKYSSYTNDSCNDTRIQFYFESKSSSNLLQLNKFYGIDKIMGYGNEIQRLTRLKTWATAYLHFEGKPLQERIYDSFSCSETIGRAKKDGYALNCRYISLIFTQFLLSAGFRARWVICNSMDLRDTECHCVTEVFIEDLNKWIVVDAALGHFYFNKKGEFLGLTEMRQQIAAGENIQIYSKSLEYKRTIQLYWLKNIFRFSFAVSNKFNMLNSPNIDYACLNPQGFVMEDRVIQTLNSKISYKYYYDSKLFIER